MKFAAALVTTALCAAAAQSSVRLEDLTWQQAEKVLTPEAIVMIPIGAGSKEHGPHLLLSNDSILAEYFTREVMKRTPVVVTPLVNYHYYPAFVDYAGSTSLRLETARDLIVDICRGLARSGPRKFYALNTGVSTIRALKPAVDILKADGITLYFTDILRAAEAEEKAVTAQKEGTHADEIETSMMLYISPKSVNMKKASKDFPSRGAGPLQHTDIRRARAIRPAAFTVTPRSPPEPRASASSKPKSMRWLPRSRPCAPAAIRSDASRSNFPATPSQGDRLDGEIEGCLPATSKSRRDHT